MIIVHMSFKERLHLEQRKTVLKGERWRTFQMQEADKLLVKQKQTSSLSAKYMNKSWGAMNSKTNYYDLLKLMNNMGTL